MSGGVTVLGEPPSALSAGTEKLYLWVETPAGSGTMRPVPYFGMKAVIDQGANDAIATAQISLNLGRNPLEYSHDPDHPQRDWQVFDQGDEPVNVWELLLGGRRIQLRTARPSGQEDWCPFDGFIERLELGWSGVGRTSRWATVFAVSRIVAADREANQFLFGQWRRSRRAALGLAGGEGHQQWAYRNECICATALPCLFNPEGRPNCDPTPLELDEGNDQCRVYVFADPDNERAEHWTVAKMQRYIQWAAIQPAAPVDSHDGDDPRVSLTVGVYTTQWTSHDLRHKNLDDMLKFYLGEPSNAQRTEARDLVMTRELADCAVQAMSVLEAFTYLCDRSGMLCYADHRADVTATGQVTTYLVFTIRGDRADLAYSSTDPGGAPSPGDPGSELVIAASTRGVYLWLPSDDTDPGDLTAPEIFRMASATEGSLLIDESKTRTGVLVLGGPTEFEISAELKPGWPADAWWDVDPDDPDAVNAAIARLNTPEWLERYSLRDATSENALRYRDVGRYWVWNEDGAFTATRFARAAGPWSSESAWWPVRFRTDVEYSGLARRGDDGWCMRRRRFLPTRAEAQPYGGGPGVALDVMVQLSFQSGAAGTWWFMPLQVTVDADRCAIWLGDDDLHQTEDPTGSGESFISAHIRGLLRVRVLANVEADDGLLVGCRPSGSSHLQHDWWDVVDRRQMQRRLRHRGPSWSTGPIANCPLGRWASHPDGYEVTQLVNDDPLDEAHALAQRLRDELELRRVSGQVTIPWLWRDGHGPRPGYRIGDEIMGIKTSLQSTFVDMSGSRAARWPASRIIGLSYRYSTNPEEQSTTLRIEDPVYTPDDQVGNPNLPAEPLPPADPRPTDPLPLPANPM